jgi:hypothetical protein
MLFSSPKSNEYWRPAKLTSSAAVSLGSVRVPPQLDSPSKSVSTTIDSSRASMTSLPFSSKLAKSTQLVVALAALIAWRPNAPPRSLPSVSMSSVLPIGARITPSLAVPSLSAAGVNWKRPNDCER